jgi:hypothetical protein
VIYLLAKVLGGESAFDTLVSWHCIVVARNNSKRAREENQGAVFISVILRM